MTSQSKLRYAYATGELLDARNTYSYTAYHGVAFLTAWHRQRDTVMGTSKAAFITTNSKPPGNSPTALLLCDVHAGLASEARGQALATLNRVLQRFEVTKRIHGEYNENWRPVDPQDYHDLDLYLQFSQALDLAYSLTHQLQYLNGLLKCMDTLTAYLHDLNIEQVENLQALARAERHHVSALRLALDGRAA